MIERSRTLFRNRSWLHRVTWPWTHYIITNLAAFSAYLFFHLLSRTTIIGKENVPKQPNTLLLSNHQSMIDSFLVGTIAFFPDSILRRSLLPWNPAAQENFYKNAILGWFADNWKCIPIKKGRKDVGAIFTMAAALRQSPMTLFPEGTRSRDGSIGKFRGGAGLLILETRPAVVPVCIDGMQNVLPIGTFVPRLFKRVYIYFGKPIDLTECYEQGKNKEVARAVITHVMNRVRQMRSELEELQSNEKGFSVKELFEGKKSKSQKMHL